jgi:hypothetical protein
MKNEQKNSDPSIVAKRPANKPDICARRGLKKRHTKERLSIWGRLRKAENKHVPYSDLQSLPGIMRSINPSNMGTVKPVSP